MNSAIGMFLQFSMELLAMSSSDMGSSCSFVRFRAVEKHDEAAAGDCLSSSFQNLSAW